MKKFLVLVISAATVFCALAICTSAAFDTTRTYDGQFTDVSENSWYAPSVKTCYEIGLMSGASATTFNPQGMFTLAEAATLAARMHNIYNGGDGKIPAGEGAWYNGAVDYCIKNGIFAKGEFTDYTRYATRAEAAGIMVAALPKTEWKAINNVTELPDVENNGGKNETAVFTLYNAGILAGSDEYGKFQPNAAITRAEVAALVVRMADADKRLTVNLKPLSERKGVVLNGNVVSVTPDGKIIFSNDGKYGVMTVDGSVVVPNEYTRIEYLENGKFMLYKDNVTKISDTSGKVLYTYNGSAKSLGDDYYLVSVSHDYNGQVLYKGNTVVVKDISNVKVQGDFLILSVILGSYGYVKEAVADKNGNILVDYNDGDIVITDDYIVRIVNRTYYFYDKSGKLLSSGDYKSVSYQSGLIVLEENGKQGLATPYGKVVDALYDRVSVYTNAKFAILNYGTMQALASSNGIIFDLGKYNKYGVVGEYAAALRADGVDIVDITGDIVASADGNYNEALAISGDLVVFANANGRYNYAYDTVSKQTLEYKALSNGYNYVSYYENDEKCFLIDGTEVAEVAVVNGYLVYKSLDGKYGSYFANLTSAAEYDTPEDLIKGNSAKTKYTVSTENGKPVVTCGDEIVIRYYQEPFYFDRITALGYNNYYICTFNNVNYIIHP